MTLPSVTLRAMEPEDLDLLYSLENDVSMWNVSTTNAPYSKFLLRQYIANSTSDIYIDKQVRLMIDDAEGTTVGIIDIINFEAQHMRAEIGLAIRREYRRQGLGRAAIQKVIDYSRSVIHLHQLHVLIDINNVSSIESFESMGFRRVAELKDWFYDGSVFHNSVIMQKIL